MSHRTPTLLHACLSASIHEGPSHSPFKYFLKTQLFCVAFPHYSLHNVLITSCAGTMVPCITSIQVSLNSGLILLVFLLLAFPLKSMRLISLMSKGDRICPSSCKVGVTLSFTGFLKCHVDLYHCHKKM